MMKENSQIAFDFFTPPTKKPGSPVQGDPAHERNGGDPVEERNTGDSSEERISGNIVHERSADNPSKERIAEDSLPERGADNPSHERIAGDSSDERKIEQPGNHIIPEITDDNNTERNLVPTDTEPIDLGYIPFVSSSRPVQPVKTRGRKSLKSYDAASAYTEVPPDDILFQKQYYPIGEVSQMFKVNASLLRYWESEFDILKPRKNKKGDRHFRPEDIKNLELIYDLLRRRKLTIDGARNFLKKNKNARERYDMIRSLQQMQSFLFELKASL